MYEICQLKGAYSKTCSTDRMTFRPQPIDMHFDRLVDFIGSKYLYIAVDT
jgi:hypothetical protein